LLLLIDQSIQSATCSNGNTSSSKDESLGKLRRKLLLSIMACEGIATNGILFCAASLLLTVFRTRTWIVVSLVTSTGPVSLMIFLLLTAPSSTKERGSFEAGSQLSANASSAFSPSLASLRRSTGTRPGSHKVTPSATIAATALLNPTAILARSQLAVAASLHNKAEFLPPQEQPRAAKLKFVATLLQNSMLEDSAIREVVDLHFIPAARAHFLECIEQARGMVPEMQKQYQEVRKGHLAIYKDTLGQIRRENTFVELQRRSEKLVKDCASLGRIQTQKAVSICDLYLGAELASTRYDTLMVDIASKTAGAVFHAAPRKGLLRVCEKLALSTGDADTLGLTTMSQEWHPERVLDVVRGAVECPNFSVMINVLRLLCDLDAELQITGETGGIKDSICITRSKGRFGQPTSGGWADIMINFHFKDDEEWMHICEIQLVHAELYGVRKHMGAHKTYNVFRAALELCEKVGANPEEGGDSNTLASLLWKPQAPAVTGPALHEPGTDLVSKMVANHDALVTILEAQAKQIVALEMQNENASAQMEKMSTQMGTMSDQIQKISTQNDKLMSTVNSLRAK
jgi:hypothetical protein